MRYLFSVTFLFFSLTASATPEIFAECHGRSWLHLILIDKAVTPNELSYQRRGYAFGVYADFPVNIHQNSPQERKISFVNSTEKFGYSVDYSEKTEVHNGTKMLVSTGSVFQNKAGTFDMVREYWFNIGLL